MSRNAEEADRQAKGEILKDQTRGIKGWFYRHYIRGVREALAGVTGRILDVGCGEDVILADTGLPRVSLDLSFLRLHRFSGNERVCGDAMTLPFKNESYSAIVLSAILEHLPDPRVALDEATRVLKPEGRVVIVLPNDLWMSLGRVLLGMWPPRHPDHLHFITPSRLIAMAPGFRVTKMVGLPWRGLPFALNMYLFAVMEKRS